MILAFRDARNRLRPVDHALLSIPDAWRKTFEDEFYIALLRLYGDTFNASENKPSWVGKWTNRFIYEPLFNGLPDELKRRRTAHTGGEDDPWLKFTSVHRKARQEESGNAYHQGHHAFAGRNVAEPFRRTLRHGVLRSCPAFANPAGRSRRIRLKSKMTHYPLAAWFGAVALAAHAGADSGRGAALAAGRAGVLDAAIEVMHSSLLEDCALLAFTRSKRSRSVQR